MYILIKGPFHKRSCGTNNMAHKLWNQLFLWKLWSQQFFVEAMEASIVVEVAEPSVVVKDTNLSDFAKAANQVVDAGYIQYGWLTRNSYFL